MSAISLQHLTKTFRNGRGPVTTALSDLNLEIPEGQLLGLVGPSGSGKSTTLRLIAGLDEPDSGEIVLGGRSMRGVPPHERQVAMVLQDHPLFPHLDVAGNITLGLKARRIHETGIRDRLEEAVALVGLRDLLERPADALSGGERQRVALAMALAKRPRWLLLDEPMAQLDAPLRVQLRGELRRLQRRLGMTTVLVTHDQAEAMAIADRLAVLHAGQTQQVGTPAELYRRPDNLRVAQFLGMPPMNLVLGRLQPRDGGFSFTPAAAQPWDLPWPVSFPASASTREVVLGVRPEEMQVLPSTADTDIDSATLVIPMFAEAIENLGGDSWIRLCQDEVRMIARGVARTEIREGAEVRVLIPKAGVHWFDAGTGWRL